MNNTEITNSAFKSDAESGVNCDEKTYRYDMNQSNDKQSINLIHSETI